MSTTIESLELEIVSNSTDAKNGIDALVRSLDKLKNATKISSGLKSISNQVRNIGVTAKQVDSRSANNLTGLAKAIGLLGGVKISSSIGNQIKSISDSLGAANFDGSGGKIQELVDALEPLSSLPKNNLSSFITSLKKLPELFTELNKMDMAAFSAKIREVANSVRPLADEMQKVANGFSAFPTKIQKLLNATNKIPKSNKEASSSFTDLYNKVKTVANSIKVVGKEVFSAIQKSSDYVENVNLFTVSMGEYASEAQRYAETVSEVMGIDPGEWMRSQGVFMTLATGFGVASDRAAVMSKNLTQLGYDLSSFFNISYEDAMEKLQSGLSGELEPLRRIGYDLSQAKLEAVALELGIDKAVSSMTQAEKAELRYYAIMTQVTTAHGDMARTLDAPANQLKVLKAQVNMAAREIGNVFIPTLNAILPPLIAAVKVIRILANNIASLFGYEMPEVDYSGVSAMGDVAGETSDAMGDAADSAKKLKSYMLGFDELNVINPNTDSTEDTSGMFDFELPEYDFMSEAVNSKVNKIVEEMKEWLGLTGEISSWSDLMDTKLGHILEIVGAIGTAIAGWKIAKMVKGIADAIKKSKLDKVAMGITLMITGFTLEFSGAYALGYEGATLDNIIKTAIGAALGIGGALLTFGTTPVGWVVGIGLALTMLISGIAIGTSKKLQEEDLAKRFGDYVLTDSEIQSLVKKITDTPLAVGLSVVINEMNTRNDLKLEVEDAIAEMNAMNFKIQCGVEVTKDGYLETVNEFLSSAQEYLAQNEMVAKMSIDLIYNESATGTRLSEFVTSFYSTTSEKLTTLGSELKDCIEQGFVDGEWIGNAEEQALKLQKEIQGILDYISEVEYEAKLNVLKLDALNTEITPESFQKLLADAQEVVSGRIEDLGEIRLEALKVAKMEYDENIKSGVTEEAARELYDAAIAEADRVFREGKLELSYGTYEFGLDFLTAAYGEEIEAALPLFQKSTEELFTEGLTIVLPEETYNNLDLLIGQLHSAIISGMDDLDISSATKANLKKMIDALSLTTEEYEKLAKEALAAGEVVPEKVAEGLSNINLLKAISGNIQGMHYMIGEHLSTDPSFLEMLSTCEEAGFSISEYMASGLLNNLEVVENAADSTVTLINDTLGEKVLEVTEPLAKNFEELGINLSEGLLKGAGLQLDKDKEKWYEWSGWIWNWFKDDNDIHSPSKRYETGGSYIAQGLYNGVSDNITYEMFKEIWERIHTAAVDTFTTMREKVDEIFKNLKKDVIDKVDALVESVNSLGEAIRDLPSSKTITITVKQISERSELGAVPKFASGGFPAQGQMFIAREAGAEMVGSIGRRTAVANNDQIVAGIAGGVAEANEEQNALLREQNTLLRALVEKESGVYIDGKHLTNSVEKYQRERGRVLITGGVV